MTSQPRLPTIDLEVDGVYILLSNQGSPTNSWYWGFYFHCAANDGWILHCTRPAGDWMFMQRTSNNVTFSQSIVVALKIGVANTDMQEVLRARISKVPLGYTDRFGPLTCRSWLLRAIDELDGEGYLTLKPGHSAEDIETEATNAATEAAFLKTRTVNKSMYSLALRAREVEFG